jgi:hypothetical protein
MIFGLFWSPDCLHRLICSRIFCMQVTKVPWFSTPPGSSRPDAEQKAATGPGLSKRRLGLDRVALDRKASRSRV